MEIFMMANRPLQALFGTAFSSFLFGQIKKFQTVPLKVSKKQLFLLHTEVFPSFKSLWLAQKLSDFHDFS